jgi:uncharacterized protein YjcR
MAIAQKIKTEARLLFLSQWTIEEIALKLGVTQATIGNWRKAEQWDKFCPPENAEIIITRRLNTLANREEKTDAEIKEFEALCRAVGRFNIDKATVDKINAETTYIKTHGILAKVNHIIETDDNGKVKKSSSRSVKKQVKNDISGVTKEKLDKIRNMLFFGYQLLWYWAKTNKLLNRIRFILKSRQIGATFYFAWEALEDAILTGDNQVFLSASRDQAEIFKAYIISFAKNYLDIELKGSGTILLSNGAELRFLSTNATTINGYHGHLYVDEVLWIMGFDKVNKIASGIATHKRWRKTYFSTASSLTHAAWKLWNGTKFNDRFPEKDRQKFDVSHEATKNGIKYADGIWRNMVNIEDADTVIKEKLQLYKSAVISAFAMYRAAVKGHRKDLRSKVSQRIKEYRELSKSDLFDVEQLRLEYSQAEFDNLFMCKPIDDSQSVFPMSLLAECVHDSESWHDYNPHAALPFGNKSVAFGYDPSKTGDGAALAILDVPPDFSKPFRVLDCFVFHGKNFTFQDAEVRAIAEKHNLCHFGMDNTGGTGITMCEKFQAWYPMLTTYYYSPQVKAALVGKMLDLMSNGRFKYLAHKQDITRSFMMITQSSTESGGAITYKSGRAATKDSAENGGKHKDHADIAWACMHACMVEAVAEREQSEIY